MRKNERVRERERETEQRGRHIERDTVMQQYKEVETRRETEKDTDRSREIKRYKQIDSQRERVRQRHRDKESNGKARYYYRRIKECYTIKKLLQFTPGSGSGPLKNPAKNHRKNIILQKVVRKNVT